MLGPGCFTQSRQPHPSHTSHPFRSFRPILINPWCSHSQWINSGIVNVFQGVLKGDVPCFLKKGRRGENQHSFKGDITSQLSFSFWTEVWMHTGPKRPLQHQEEEQKDRRNLNEFQGLDFTRPHRTCKEFGSYSKYNELSLKEVWQRKDLCS